MGVPKFFRYISERYPCLGEVLREYQLPEFDNLYLDMNGIIHICSHPNDNDPHFRITEEQIFRDIFHYIETLFRMIQPQKLFFMAVDGVAPRAKMNQQRGRRFRSAKEAEVSEARARERGEDLPSEERFDSNCITPGTEFMTRLQAQLMYFVTFKVSTDKLWQKVKVILSGHEVPGEGEHKIMDYIRYMKSQPGYDPNTRHCLYGLDADLIMLGLCTHEPRFSLLREEVKYGKKNSQKRIPTPEETTFFLLHLSLLREYLDLEFQSLKTTLPFKYDMECIVDDWVMMGFLVGNDFIPHLPEMHINKGALPILYKTYMEVLPTLGGYINEGGELNLGRFQKFMEKLAAFDFEQFKEYNADLKYFEGKTGRRPGGKERHSYKNSEEEPSLPPKNKDLAALIASTEEMLEGSEEDEDDENYIDIDSDDEDDEDSTSIAEFRAMKNNYYMEKLEYANVTPQVLRDQGEGYVRAIQWNLNYYYNGCCSWSWFYPHHYAPYISDIKNFSGLKLDFDLGKPFLPFQQLLAVLPAASKKLLPSAYHELMENDTSPIIDFYPTDFKTDLNGKRQDWEAVVLIPFIDQGSLLDAMETKEQFLNEEEQSRNKHGPMQVYTYCPENLGSYVAPAFFPALANHHAKEENIHREELYVDKSKLIKGLCPGVRLDVYFPGFPTLRHIPFTAGLQKAKVKVFESPSQGENMILSIRPQGNPNVSEVASQLLGKSIFVNWPHLLEARVVGVANEDKRFSWSTEIGITSENFNKTVQAQWALSEQAIRERYQGRMGIDVGNTAILVYACTLEDKKFIFQDDKMQCEKQWSKYPVAYALQTTRTNLEVYEPQDDYILSIEKVFPVGSTVFSLEPITYGSMGTVTDQYMNDRVKVEFNFSVEPNLQSSKLHMKKMNSVYFPGGTISQRIGISSHLLSRITGTILVLQGDIQQEVETRSYKLNIGLNLKFNKRNEEVCGYTRREKNGYWLYSNKAEQEVYDYKQKFPEVFNYLMDNSNSENVHASSIYPENTAEKIAELGSWLKERESNKAERQTCGAMVLEEELVLLLEKFIDDFFEAPNRHTSSSLCVKASSLYVPKPKLGQAPDPSASHQLFDRIINIRESHTVPLGARGTIIGIHNTDKGPEAIYDILFDKEFTGGLKLRCSPHRGYRLPGQAFINVTFGMTNKILVAKGKPTAVVEPTGTQEEIGHLSAFASWTNLPNQPTDFSQQYGYNQKGRRPQMEQRSMDSPQRNRNMLNSYREPAQPQLSKEFLAIFQQLQKAGPSNNGQTNNTINPASSSADPSNALKKMLRIADDTNNKIPLSDKSPAKAFSSSQSNCMQLLSLHQRQGLKLPRYLYSDTEEGAIVCTVICANGKEFQGSPAYSNDPAAESAALNALQWLESNGGLSARLYVSGPTRAATLQINPPQRPVYSPRMPQNMAENWREPAIPSTLPNPPTNWYQGPRSNFLPEWTRSGSTGRGASQPFVPHIPRNYFEHNQHNQYNHHNQAQVPPWQHRPSFIPPQAEAKIRQHGGPPGPASSQGSSHYRHGHTTSENFAPRHQPTTHSEKPDRMPTSNAMNTGRNSTRPPRSRLAANFSKPFHFNQPSGGPK